MSSPAGPWSGAGGGSACCGGAAAPAGTGPRGLPLLGEFEQRRRCCRWRGGDTALASHFPRTGVVSGTTSKMRARTALRPMRVEVTDPSHTDDLVEFLRRCDCAVQVVGFSRRGVRSRGRQRLVGLLPRLRSVSGDDDGTAGTSSQVVDAHDLSAEWEDSRPYDRGWLRSRNMLVAPHEGGSGGRCRGR
jgi:hypothetical protein